MTSTFCFVPQRHFTLDEANRTLPLVRRIVADITSLHPQWRDLVQRYELVAAQARPDWGESAEQIGLRQQIDAVARQINDYLVELDEVGCEFKGFEQGLVDFRGELDGREVYWCWKQGEDSIEHYHEIEAGFAGRRRLGG